MSQQDLFDYVMNTPHNTNPAILKQKIKDISGVSSWNDLEDKPFYTEYKRILCVSAIVPSGSHKAEDCIISNAVEVGKTYTVNFNGTEYKEVAVYCDGFVGLGNGSYDEWYDYQTDAPFWFEFTDNGTYIYASEVGLPITVYWEGEVVHQVPPQFIPNSVWTEKNTRVILENQTVKGRLDLNTNTFFAVGETVTVVWDGVVYERVARDLTGTSVTPYVGEIALMEETNSTGEPFGVLCDPNLWRVSVYSCNGEVLENENTHTVSVYVHEEVVKTNCDFMVAITFNEAEDGTANAELLAGDFTIAKEKFLKGLPLTAFVYETEVFSDGAEFKGNYISSIVRYCKTADGEEGFEIVSFNSSAVIYPDNTINC